MEFKNVSPFGDLDVDGVGPVKAGERFTAEGDLAKSLLEQPLNFERVDKPRKSKDEE